MSMIVARVVESHHATLHELQTIYGLEDLWDLYEIHAVAQHNEYLAVKRANKR